MPAQQPKDAKRRASTGRDVPRTVQTQRVLAHRSPRESSVRSGMSIAKRHRRSQAPVGAACVLTLAGRRAMPLLTRIFHTSDAGAPACCRLTRSEWSKPATCRRSGLLAFRAGYEIPGLTELENNASGLRDYRHAAPDGAIPSAQAWEMSGPGPQTCSCLRFVPPFFPHVKRLARTPILQNGDNSRAANSSD